jgi:quinohemoprotein ethanol dehydrogenase
MLALLGRTAMKRSRARSLCLGLAAPLWLCACRMLEPGPVLEPAEAAAIPPTTARALASIDDARLRDAGFDPRDWITHGRTYSEQRFSPLSELRADNVGRLGLAWSFDTETDRGLEATPLVVDGVMFTTGSWSVVFAIDARSGRLLWKYDPQVPRETGPKGCCDAVNRGVALYQDKVFVGTFDGRLVALDATSGEPVWEAVTVDQSRPYTITGAPRVVEGLVIIGNGGAELGVRGYVSAYAAETGALVWRTYTVPGDPSQPFESPALERAAKTWNGGEWWKVGGGGTVWDSMAYDPDLRLLYVGTGNGSPWSRYVRSPGGGDNLYLSSILALRPDTGELVWHYQETPGDTWDYTATQHIILADLELGGRPRRVLLHAPKNGFFYVLDRASGELLSAEKFADVNWAERVDLKTGRPVEAKGLDYRKEMKLVKPAPIGAHNWQPMSFNPQTGLVYIPAQDVPGPFLAEKKFEYRPGDWNTGTDLGVYTAFPREIAGGSLLAWDPIRQKAAWRVAHKGPWNGGTLTTAGNLVFQGTADGRFVAYAADTGKPLWEAPAGSGVVAAPITYSIDGEQYVSVMAGWGGVFALYGGDAAAANRVRSIDGRLLTFKLGGNAVLPPREPTPERVSAFSAPPTVPAETIAEGELLFARNCMACHGAGAVGGGVIPDLRHISPEVKAGFGAIVRDGALRARGMPGFPRLETGQIDAILAYLQKRAVEEKP